MDSYRIPYILLIALLAGCASTTEQKQAAAARLSPWVGKPVSELIHHAGPPDKEYNNTDGSVLYIFKGSRKETRPGRKTPTTYTVNKPVFGTTTVTEEGGYARKERTRHYNCAVTFTTFDNIIKKWAWRGNDCYRFIDRRL